MTLRNPIIIIGAGITGLTRARRLADAGLELLVLDKGRGIGGRIATRRADGGIQFDHGAQYVTAHSDEFADLLDQAVDAGAVARWDDGSDRQRFVGVPGMTALTKFLGRGLEIRQKTEVTGVRKIANGWSVDTADASLKASIVIITTPAPQVINLIGAANPLSEQLAEVQLDPCLTLMVALAPTAPRPFVNVQDPDDPLSWIAQDNSKPGRGHHSCWVAQASPVWSRAHLELDRDNIADRMLPLFCDKLGVGRATAIHTAAHRWRYARVAAPLGKDCLSDDTGTLFVGGDWCLGARVEAAWTSGAAIANRILRSR